jgi:hypothetical protein
MEQKMYGVEISEGCTEFVIAYSKEHAIVEAVNSHISLGTNDYPSDYTLDMVREIQKNEMKNILIDYNYITEKEETDTLYNIFKNLTKTNGQELEIFGAVGDDYIMY